MTPQQILELAKNYCALDGRWRFDEKDLIAFAQSILEAECEDDEEPFGWVCKADPDRTTAFFWESGNCCDICGGKRTPV